MINFTDLKVEDFDFEIKAEDIRAMGKFILFPVNVLLKSSGEVAFSENVQVNAKFHKQLQGEDNYEESIATILKARIRPRILDIIREDDEIQVQEKVNLIKLGKISF